MRIRLPLGARRDRLGRASSAIVSLALVAGVSVAGVKALGRSGPVEVAQPSSGSGAGNAQASPAPSAVETVAAPSPSASWTPYVFPGDTPGCTDGTNNPCAHIRHELTGINGNLFIPITISVDNPEPRVGQTVTIRAEVYDGDDPTCCAIEITVEKSPRPTIISCQSGTAATPYPTRTSASKPAVKVFRWYVSSPGRWIINVHAKGRCGQEGGSEQTGWQSIGTIPECQWQGGCTSPRPSPSPSSPPPQASPPPSPVASTSPSPSASPSDLPASG